nr:hypothetical protein [Tanacetum cinerariifolium]
MMLQLTDITSEITDEELLEFTSEYYILLALHPVVPAVNACIAEFPVGKLGMDLFSGVHLSKPKLVTEGVRPLRDGEEPLLEATIGRTMELVLEPPEDENTAVLEPTPLQAVGITRAESETEEVNSGLKHKRDTSGDGAGSSKRKDEEIALLKAQLVDARVEAESARSYAHKLAEEKMLLLVQLDQERASSADHRASCH